MKLVIAREDLLKPLSLVAGVVERRQTLPILSNILLVHEGDSLTLTGTDLEVELQGRVQLEAAGTPGAITVPARKLMDICKTLPDDAMIEIELDGEKVRIKSGRSKFSLSSLPASDFPNVEEGPKNLTFSIGQKSLRHIIDRTAIAMAQQDVRYYLNGMLFEITQGNLRAVATDGHRLAMSEANAEIQADELSQVIIPRKGILELARLLDDESAEVTIVVGSNHIRAVTESFVFTSKLVDGKFPDYQQVIPKGGNCTLIADRDEFRQVLSRASILSNEKYRGVRLIMKEDVLQVFANNPEQEEAEESLPVKYDGDPVEIGFNVSYLLDVLNVVDTQTVKTTLNDSNSSALMEEVTDAPDSLYVVMPMRL